MYKLWIAVLLGSAGLARAAPAQGPRLSFGTATAKGAIDARAIGLVIKSGAGRLLGCYTGPLARAPRLKGTVIATFTIGSEGKVTAVWAIGVSDEVEDCVSATIAKLKFARPRLGTPIEIRVPLTYVPDAQIGIPLFSSIGGTDDGLYDGLADSPSVGGGRDGNYGFGRKDTPLGRGSVGAATASIGPVTVTGALDRAIVRQYLQHELPTLRDCYVPALDQHPTLQGTVTARFTIGAEGRVTSATASGLHDEAVEACVARAVQAIEFPRPRQGRVVVTAPLTLHPASAAAR
jgi:hypothetical protein